MFYGHDSSRSVLVWFQDPNRFSMEEMNQGNSRPVTVELYWDKQTKKKTNLNLFECPNNVNMIIDS